MRIPLMNAHLMKKAGFIALLVLAPVTACTDLTEVPSSSISPENFYANEAEVIDVECAHRADPLAYAEGGDAIDRTQIDHHDT